MSIPADQIVSVSPSVLSAGGNALALNGLILTEASVLPYGSPVSFSSASDVATYFGSSSDEAAMASVYFNGYTTSYTKPSSIYFYRYANVAIPAFMRGASSSSTLTNLQAFTAGSLYIVTDGAVASISTINLSTISSFSDAATRMTSAFTGSTKPTVTYDSTFQAFVATSNSTGSLSTINYATGTLASTLGFTSTAGAVLSQGENALSPSDAMENVTNSNQNWAAFTTTFEPDLATKKLFANWNASKGSRYLYACWDTDTTAWVYAGTGATFGEWLTAQNVAGTSAIWYDKLLAAFVLGITASIDFTRTEGRTNYAFRSGTGNFNITSVLWKASNLLANGYNIYGTYATANDQFTWLYKGTVSGPFKWIDSYVNAIWLNNSIQLAEMSLLANMSSIPYNQDGYNMIKTAALDPIGSAVNAGVIRPNVSLSAAQAIEVNTSAGVTIDTTLSTRGWYFQVQPATAQVRAARQTPPCTLWYMDGESVQQIDVASVDIQ